MRIVIIGVALIIGLILFIGMVIVGYTMLSATKEELEKDKEPVLSSRPLLEGEFLWAEEDILGSGLSRVFIKNEKGRKIYGFSTFSVDELNYLYKDKGSVVIPLTDAPNDRAYQMEKDMEVDYWDGN